jgi:hypothetical protein
MHSITVHLHSLYRQKSIQIMLKLALFAGIILLLYNQLLSGAEKLSDVETFHFSP